MNKVIDGKRYDTKTAKELGEKNYYDNGNWFSSVTLYRKKTGEYFLATKGNGSQIYAPDDSIEPVTVAQAKAWAEEHLDGDDYENIFGEIDEVVEENGPLRQISLLLPESMLKKLREKKEATGTTVTALIIKAVRDAGY